MKSDTWYYLDPDSKDEGKMNLEKRIKILDWIIVVLQKKKRRS